MQSIVMRCTTVLDQGDGCHSGYTKITISLISYSINKYWAKADDRIESGRQRSQAGQPAGRLGEGLPTGAFLAGSLAIQIRLALRHPGSTPIRSGRRQERGHLDHRQP